MGLRAQGGHGHSGVAKRNGLGGLEPDLDPMGRETPQRKWVFLVSRGHPLPTPTAPLRTVSGQVPSTAGLSSRGWSAADSKLFRTSMLLWP